ncbi:hypothetical protein [Dactylosporangium salmoneum]|uniref:DUF4232 domain-containing protein n=1 Tax=Dactylosporangium salmoneum TaxID=53361 RepID=A0ABN3GPU8_9ACTN
MDLETRLRDTLADDRHALPGWDDAVERVGGGVRRRRRRRAGMVALAAVGVLLPVLVSAALISGRLGGDGGGQVGAGGAVPWVGETVAQRYDVARRSPRPDRQACTAEDLGDMWSEPGDGLRTLLIGNIRAERCTLSGRPRVTAVDSTTGVRVTADAADLVLPADPARQFPATVGAGEPVRVDLRTGSACSPGRYRDVMLEVAGRTYPLDGVDPSCGLEMSGWYVQPPLLNMALTVQMTAPKTVRVGEQLVYLVTIINTMNQAVQLTPCPQVRQSLGTSAGTYLLNCAPKRLGAHTRTTFEMRISAPAQPGVARLRWMAVFSDGKVAIAELATDGLDVTVTG